MSHHVRIEQFDREILVESGETILGAALEAGLDYPFMCQQGQCGSCKSFLLEGEVDLGHVYNPLVLTEAERARGFILACQARPRSDCAVSINVIDGAISHPVRAIDCVVATRESAARETTIVRLEPLRGGPLIFSAGQYAALTFPGQPPRDYSMANRPDDPMLEFHIQRMHGGGVSAHVATGLAVGDPVSLRGPYGSAYFREEHLGPILLAAGGTGLAPLQSIVETALAMGATQRLHLYFGVRAEADLYRQDRLRELASRHRNLIVVTTLAEPNGEGAHRHGTPSDAIAADFRDLGAFHAYVAGPPAHCEAVRRVCIARGLPEAACFMDPFVSAIPSE
jgi:CDP-4-dehydro-6-deoxyglucose reductase/ferredoxin-NAD(P)+ reductase (naphthalene dioxygenase ferredoxin-specific)